MKNSILIIFILLISKLALAHASAKPYKVNEYEDVGIGCQEYFRMMDFIEEINKNEGSRGLIVLYTGDDEVRFGNILGHISGTKQFLEKWVGIPSEKISFVVTKGKKFSTKELWILPKNTNPPEIKSFEFNWNNLETKYFFGTACFLCEPSYPLLTAVQPNFEDYSKILKTHPNYKGQITVNNFQDLFQVRSTLVNDYKLPRNRFSIQLAKKTKGEDESISVDLYIVPNKLKSNYN